MQPIVFKKNYISILSLLLLHNDRYCSTDGGHMHLKNSVVISNPFSSYVIYFTLNMNICPVGFSHDIIKLWNNLE